MCPVFEMHVQLCIHGEIMPRENSSFHWAPALHQSTFWNCLAQNWFPLQKLHLLFSFFLVMLQNPSGKKKRRRRKLGVNYLLNHPAHPGTQTQRWRSRGGLHRGSGPPPSAWRLELREDKLQKRGQTSTLLINNPDKNKCIYFLLFKGCYT